MKASNVQKLVNELAWFNNRLNRLITNVDFKDSNVPDNEKEYPESVFTRQLRRASLDLSEALIEFRKNA